MTVGSAGLDIAGTRERADLRLDAGPRSLETSGGLKDAGAAEAASARLEARNGAARAFGFGRAIDLAA